MYCRCSKYHSLEPAYLNGLRYIRESRHNSLVSYVNANEKKMKYIFSLIFKSRKGHIWNPKFLKGFLLYPCERKMNFNEVLNFASICFLKGFLLYPLWKMNVINEALNFAQICFFAQAKITVIKESCCPQFYIQLVFKAPLCITLTISDQKIVSGSLFWTEFFYKATF